MTVLACSNHTAVYGWEQDGAQQQGVFEIRELRKKPTLQQQQQQQPQPENGFGGKEEPEEPEEPGDKQ